MSLGQGLCYWIGFVLMVHDLSLHQLPVLGDVSEVLLKPEAFTLALFLS